MTSEDRAHCRDIEQETLRFPAGFVWGSGISAHQAEGDNRNNDWWAFEQAGKVAGGVVSGSACNHYYRYKADFDLAVSLGQKAFKSSVEWSRIEPVPERFETVELDHYEDYVLALKERGIEPWVTLHHFTSPLWLKDSGWWEGAETPELFARFVRVVAERLAPHVRMWLTINEPMLFASAGYVFGIWPPEKRSVLAARRVARNLVRAHRLAYGVLREVCGPKAQIGAAINVTALKHPGRPTLRDRLLGGAFDRRANHYFMKRVRKHSDFIGMQYFTRPAARWLRARGSHAASEGACQPQESDLGWEIYPKGLYDSVMEAWRRYGLPIYVTENGVADAGDRRRARFIRDHLVWLHRAIAEDADVRGYLHWSLLDNFEWREGFSPRFGLVEVDYTTQERRVRPSARYYERICRENAVGLTPPRP